MRHGSITFIGMSYWKTDILVDIPVHSWYIYRAMKRPKKSGKRDMSKALGASRTVQLKTRVNGTPLSWLQVAVEAEREGCLS